MFRKLSKRFRNVSIYLYICFEIDIMSRESTTGRRAIILEILDKDGQVDVQDLSTKLGVSEVTIRKDLGRLEEKRVLIRTRGGAIKATPVNVGVELDAKRKIQPEEKKAIGKLAASLINEGETIILDSGSTTLAMVEHLESFSDLQLITNSLSIAFEVRKFPHIRTIIPGGVLRPESESLVGSMALENFGNFRSNKLFLGVDGLDINTGLSTPFMDEAAMNRKMIEIASEVIVVADSSKFMKTSFLKIDDLDKVDVIVTDSGIDSEICDRLREIGLEVLIAK